MVSLVYKKRVNVTSSPRRLKLSQTYERRHLKWVYFIGLIDLNEQMPYYGLLIWDKDEEGSESSPSSSLFGIVPV